MPADKAAIDLYPEQLRAEIDELNDWVYHTVNSRWLWALKKKPVVDRPFPPDGVYKSGFAQTQKAYEDAVYNAADTISNKLGEFEVSCCAHG